MARDQRTRPTRTGSGLQNPLGVQGLHSPQMSAISRNGAQCAFAAALLSLLFVTQQVGPPTSVVLVVDGVSHQTVTARRTVARVLDEMGIDLDGILLVAPPLDAAITPGRQITVHRLLPLILFLPERELIYRGTALTAKAVLDELGVALGPRDLLRAGTALLTPGSDLRALRTAGAAHGSALVTTSRLRIEGVRAARNPLRFTTLEPVRITLERALPIVVHERGQAVDLAVRGATLREALAEAGVPILPVDLVRPDPEMPPQAGLHVYLERAKDLTLTADGRTRSFRSRAERVDDLLREQGLALGSLDLVTPSLAGPLRDGVWVRVVRVREEQAVEEETTPFVRQRVPTGELSLGQKRVTQAGSPGTERRFYRVRYEDGQEVARALTATLTPIEPRTEIIEFGTRAETVSTPEGPMEYLRTMRVWATWYNASHGGKPATSPAYGITSIGLKATKGVMAVDPRIIPYWTKAYVPGYGIAVAGDTGGAVKGNIIDLAFDEDATVTWSSRSTDIYILGSPTLKDAFRAAFPDE